MIDTVIFDLGKVLVEYDWESYLKQFCFDEKTFPIFLIYRDFPEKHHWKI